MIPAVQAGELRAFLTGEQGYAIANPYLDTPTEPMAVFRAYLEAYGAEPGRMVEFAETVRQLSHDPLYSWFSVYYLMDFLEHPGVFGPSFDLHGLVREVLANVKAQAPALRQLKRWAGATDADGCWGVVDRLVGQLKKYHASPGFDTDG